MSRTIVLIHGAWLNSRSWEHWQARYQAKGHVVLAPDWPHDEGEPAALRAQSAPELASVGQGEIVAHYEHIIRGLPEKPILIGHSLGAVYVQMLLDKGLGACGVAINPAPTPGVPLGWNAFISALPVLGDPFSRGKVKQMSRRFFRTRFAQSVPRAEADALYDRYIVPTPGRVYWDGAAGSKPLSWRNPDRAPLLLIGGGEDLIADASMARAIYKKQRLAPARTEYREFEARSHWTVLEPGWQGVADFVLDWAVAAAGPLRASASETRWGRHVSSP